EGIQTKKYQDFTSGTPSENPTIVKIDTAILHQSMIGFGGNITESCLENLKKLSPSDKENFFKIFFDQKSGAGFSYLRVPIGANDFSIGDYSLNDTPGNKPDPQLKLYNPKKLQVFIQFIQEAKKYNPDIKLIMTPWTAPAWMKDTKSLKGGQIKKKYYRAYSDYLIKTINEFESKGIKIDQMTILNEPLIGYAKEHWDFPQTYMSPQDQSHFIQDSLLPKLKGKQTKLLIHDHNWDNAHAADPVFADNKQNPAVQGIAYHCYGGSLSDLQKNLKNHPGVPAFNTECTSSLNHHSDEDTFNWWQDTQSLDAIKSGISGSLGWNLCLDEKGGPQNNGCEDCRGLMTIDSKTSAMTLNPEFKALATTSRVLDSGSIMIDSKESNPQATSIAFKNPDGSLSMVLKNKSKISQAYNVNVDSCASKKYFLPAGATLSVRWFPD
ncbi:MAG TPA: glycoside hydrolase family 30 beta sandwich domain-containing protein, partial [Pseudobdellovibrionaceae bacterium]